MAMHLIGLLRQVKGLTLAELAARANVRPRVLELAEAGTQAPTTANMQRIARALGVAVEDLTERPAPGLENMPEWRHLAEALYQTGNRDGWDEVRRYLVVMIHALGRDEAIRKAAARAGR